MIAHSYMKNIKVFREHPFHHWNVAKNRSACFLNLCVTNSPYAPLPYNTPTKNNQHTFFKDGKIHKY